MHNTEMADATRLPRASAAGSRPPLLGTLLQDAFALPHDTLITGDLPLLLSQLSLLPATDAQKAAVRS
ncbi:hypothetical protein [Sphingomonas desiccabilis]|uniref:Uncharacterized protein n=1 Tax=Sphingomonas desiccabilis TaxID=429134 RepID=A0A4Q2ITG4_9SPHN|nr:hypothetical protein [Sphingomonas desiccabilis]MBB3911813.1 hypothetical protein [Sphingomonas desiccabilis]RXZ31469.1 hypothetical protein EO081_09485 [Sphingomonas desiccabilis]